MLTLPEDVNWAAEALIEGKEVDFQRKCLCLNYMRTFALDPTMFCKISVLSFVRSFTLKQPDDLPGRDPGGKLASIGVL